MTLCLLYDMQSPNNELKTWKKGQVIDLGSEDSEVYIQEGKAKLFQHDQAEVTEQIPVEQDLPTDIEK